MFKGFQNTSRTNGFNGFPALNFRMNNQAYGFSGCSFWLDAAYGLNTQTDLAAVSSWQTRIGGVAFTQSTAANQPTLVLSDASFNNLPTINFTAGNTRFMLSSPNSYVGLGNVTIAIVYQIQSTSTNGNRLVSDSTTANNAIGIASNGANAGMNGLGLYTGTSTSTISGTTEDTNPHIGILSDRYVYVNGVQEATGSSQFIYGFNQLGSQGSTNNTATQAKIAEIIIFNRLMTDLQMANLSTNINSKYAIY